MTSKADKLSWIGPKSVEKLSKADWKAMSSKQRWDILTALRGPDLSGEIGTNLKWFTTGVIRQRMWGLLKPTGGSAMKNGILPFMVVSQGTFGGQLPGLAGFDYGHFIGHMIESAQILHIPLIVVDTSNYIKLLKGLHGNINNAGVTMIQLAKETGIGLPADIFPKEKE